MHRREAVDGDLTRLERLIAASECDAVVAFSPENVRYISNVHLATQLLIRDRLACVVWPKGRDPIALVCLVEKAYVESEGWIRDVRTYREFVTDPMAALAEILQELGLAR